MPTNVLVVDDSAFFRRRIKEILEKTPELKVIGFADNGKAAVEQSKSLKPDVITMDYEMPLMDGISAVRLIMSERPTPILMFSSLSYEGARVTLDALEAGALDYLPKSFESMSGDPGDSAKLLQDRVIAIARRGAFMRRTAAPVAPVTAAPTASPPVPKPSAPSKLQPKSDVRQPAKPKGGKSPIESLQGDRPRIILIGASTGGKCLQCCYRIAKHAAFAFGG